MFRTILLGSTLAVLVTISGGAFAGQAAQAPAEPIGAAVDMNVDNDVREIRNEVRSALREARTEIRNAVREQARALAVVGRAMRNVHLDRHITVAVNAAAHPTPAAPVAPPAPPAPRAAPAPVTPATPAAVPTLRTAPRNFDAKGLYVDGVYGNLTVEVASGPVTVVLTGRKTVLDRVTMNMQDGVLRVVEHSGVDSSWDIFRWLGYGDHGRADRLDVHIRAPKGTPLNVDGLVGNIAVGDLEAPVKLELAATSGTVGNVTRANVDMAGGGKLRIARVSGQLTAEVAGSGSVITGPVGNADVEIAGAGSATMGAVSGGIKATIAGSGDVAAARVAGPVRVEIAGSGSVKIASGTADPLRLEIMGSGDFDFGGEAVNPHVEVLGSGRVHIKSYRGNLTTEGTSHVQIGSRE